MTFKLLTIFPDMLRAVLGESILGRAISSGAISVEVIDIRAFSENRHKNTDDAPYGGGAGMVMLAQAATDAIRHAMGDAFCGRRIYLSPRGRRFDQRLAEELSKEKELILLAGHYEGLDQRVIDGVIDEEISVGDYVLTGGELGALVITDAVARLLPGVLGSDESSVDESFSAGLLEYPHYTRPREYEGRAVPEVLLGGNQSEIDAWRRREALKITLARRPELLESAPLTGFDRAYLRQLKTEMSLMLRLGVRDETKKKHVQARLYEVSHGLVCFEDGDLPLHTDADALYAPQTGRLWIDRLPDENERNAARERGIELCGFTPFAFCPAFRELINDDSLLTLVFSGVTAEEFACLASMVLPVRKIKGGAVCFARDRRALLAQGRIPRCEAETRAGECFVLDLDGESEAYFKKALAFLRDAKMPLEEESIRVSRETLKALAANA